jgi:hypothetical protein
VLFHIVTIIGFGLIIGGVIEFFQNGDWVFLSAGLCTIAGRLIFEYFFVVIARWLTDD